MRGVSILILFIQIIIGISGVVTVSLAKPDPTRELLRSAFDYYNQGQYYEAIRFYEEALLIDSTLSEAHYYMADCYQYLFQYELASKHYKSVDPTHKPEYPLLAMNLGLVQKSLGNYEQAETHFKEFAQQPNKQLENNEYWLERAKDELASLAKIRKPPFAPQINPNIVKLPSPVNTESHDFAAVPYRDSSHIVITSTRMGSKGNQYHVQHGEAFSDNYVFLADSNHWKETTQIHHFTNVNSTLDDGPGVLSEDGNTYYFTRTTHQGDYHIYYSLFVNNQWKMPRPLPAPVNLPGYVSKHPALSASGDTLFFSSDRPGGLGKSDLWMSVRHQDEWQHPINLGPSINTSNHETSPHWNAETETLFFASNGHPGWGGFDLFTTTILPYDLPSQVINLGKPLNSSKDDTYIWVGKNYGYVTSNRDSTLGNFDIYKYQYDNESKVLLSLTSESFWDLWASRLGLSDEEQREAQKFFSTLPSEEQDAMQRAVRKRIFNTLLAEGTIEDILSMDESQQFLSVHGEKIQEMVENQIAFYLNFQIPTWKDETRKWFSALEPNEKDKIEKIVQTMVIQSLLQQEDASVLQGDYQYEELSAEQFTWVEQTTAQGVRSFREFADEFIALEEVFEWQTLSPEEKEQLSRELSYRHFSSVALSSDETLEQVRYRYEQLPIDKQEQIDRLAQALIVNGKASNNVQLNEDAFQLEVLSSEEQRSLARLVVYRAEEMRKRNAGDNKMEAYVWEELPQETKYKLQRGGTNRQFAKRIVSDPSIQNQSYRQQINLHALLQANPDVVTIRGRIKQTQSKGVSVPVSLGTKYNRLRTQTDSEGVFSFSKVNYLQSSQIFLGEAETSMSEMLSLYLEEIEIIVDQDSLFTESFDHIYFETNSYQLTGEAVPVLSRIVNFHQSHPDVTIQIHAYADSTGSRSFNYQLSKKRSESVFSSLVSKGVDSNKLKLVPKGKEETNQSNDLAYSRRVEFKITGTNTTFNPTREIYLISSNTDLDVVARRYKKTVKQILEDNPGLGEKPSPYSVIKITTNLINYER
uniref:OmpA family protein n=1 Tax=Roseihalotalea indica TaxID=2867963 RepID=A0AA49JDP5_9BACT|nr:OmpA family protein [Tunicatimonas sp. TK19036]